MSSADKFSAWALLSLLTGFINITLLTAIIFCCKQVGDIFKWKIEKVKVNIPKRGYIIGKLKAKDTAVKGKRVSIRNKKFK